MMMVSLSHVMMMMIGNNVVDRYLRICEDDDVREIAGVPCRIGIRRN